MSDYTPTILIVTGPTATGKTKLALEIAKEYNGELISADSRQVYKYMDIGTGKDLPLDAHFNLKETNKNLDFGFYNFNDIPVWGLDIVKPDYSFNVADWVFYANKIILDIKQRGKLPIIVGGTGQYIRSLVNPPETLYIPVNPELRTSLENLSISDLQKRLSEVNKDKWEKMNSSDRQNPRRLIRAIEVAGVNKQLIKPTPLISSNNWEYVSIGLTDSRSEINGRIDFRVEDRIKRGMLKEVEVLLGMGYSWGLPSLSATGYQEFKQYFVGGKKLSLNEISYCWKVDEHQYAKRQLTYLVKYLPNAKWFELTKENWKKDVKNFLSENLKNVPIGS